MVQWAMALFGILFAVFSTYIFGVTTHIVYNDAKENMFLHLDGNTSVFENFINVTLTRGILKMDILGNLNYFLCLGFLFIID